MLRTTGWNQHGSSGLGTELLTPHFLMPEARGRGYPSSMVTHLARKSTGPEIAKPAVTRV